MTGAFKETRTMSNSTGAVLQKHLRAARVDVDAVMDDYTEQSVLITHEATYRGLAEIRSFFTTLFRDLPKGFFESIRITREEVVGEMAYILWDRDPFSRATDTFVVRDGKIAFQTFTP
jgi:ketosteroid isomerase-like protein